jgi:hypothetical protein
VLLLAEDGLMHLEMQHKRQQDLAEAYSQAVQQVSGVLQATVAANK